ncbi:MAG: TIGR04282 family arsenosugar biosynthesis glycosyltransferase [Gammaproteobacteria bacterium]
MPEPEHIPSRNDSCLVVFFKAPDRSKRRLADEIGELAARAATHLWDCIEEDVNSWNGSVCYAPAELSDANWLSRQLHAPHSAVLQHGRNLGARINHVDRVLRHGGERKLIFVGTDCPAMKPEYLARADVLLEDYDVVLGPASDGGVVLMGARVGWPPLTDLPWSTSKLHAELTQACLTHGLSITDLEQRDDVDTVAELLAAGQDLADDRRPARQALVNWLMEPNPAWTERS